MAPLVRVSPVRPEHNEHQRERGEEQGRRKGSAPQLHRLRRPQLVRPRAANSHSRTVTVTVSVTAALAHAHSPKQCIRGCEILPNAFWY